MKKLIYIVLVYNLFSCNSTINNSENKGSSVNKQDTVIKLMVNGISQEYNVKKNCILRLEKFQEFLNKFQTVPNIFIDTLITDIDGNKNQDLVITEITRKNNDFILVSTIIMNNKTIIKDTLETDNELAFIDWDSDSIYYKLKPYTSFYNSYREKNIVEELKNGKLSEDIIDFYIGGVSAELTNQNIDSITIKHTIDSIKFELNAYKGKIVTSLDHWDRSILIWNKYSDRFDIIYTP